MAAKKIAFVGPMGSGKSTLAMQYKAKFGGAVFDTDEVFTSLYGNIARYIKDNGEDAFRKIEHELVLQAVKQGVEIISCGGGVVLDKRNMSAMRSGYDIVCLTAPVSILKMRIAKSDRPFKGDIEIIVEEREHLYRRYADYTIDTSNGNSLQHLSDVLCRPRPTRYDILLCDADDTVLDCRQAIRTSIIGAARSVGIKADDERIVKEFGDVNDIVWRQLEDGGLSHEQLNPIRFAMLKDRLGENFEIADISEAFLDNMYKTRFVLDGATEFLSAVRARGIKVYISTNGSARGAHGRLKALDGYIDGSFISAVIGYSKPDPRFFDHIFSELGGVDKARTLVFGDSVTSDISGGINSGLDTCLFDPSGTLKSDADYSVRTYEEILRIL